MSKKKKTTLAGYIIGSIAVGTVTAIIIPELLNKGASHFYKKLDKPKDHFNDTKDLIVRKNK